MCGTQGNMSRLDRSGANRRARVTGGQMVLGWHRLAFRGVDRPPFYSVCSEFWRMSSSGCTQHSRVMFGHFCAFGRSLDLWVGHPTRTLVPWQIYFFIHIKTQVHGDKDSSDDEHEKATIY